MNGFSTIKEAAEALRLSPETVYKLARTGKLPAIKIGWQWRIKLSEIKTKETS